MTKEEIIKNLEDQLEDREGDIDADDPDCIFLRDAEALREAIKLLSDTPNPVVHGRWINLTGLLFDPDKCSVCGGLACNTYGMKYCPRCGAKMDKGDTDGKAN